jgi:hypothetical protein
MLDVLLVELLSVLAGHGVEFVLVGGVACVFHGAPVVTFDLDVLYRRTPENNTRLLTALRDLDATFRGDARKLHPNATHVGGPGRLLLATRLGPLASACSAARREATRSSLGSAGHEPVRLTSRFGSGSGIGSGPDSVTDAAIALCHGMSIEVLFSPHSLASHPPSCLLEIT